MKLLIGLIALSAIGGTPGQPSLQTTNDRVAQIEVSVQWYFIEGYITMNAVNDDPVVRAMLYAEAILGVKTWTVTSNSLNVASFDGGSIGWPAAGKTISFPSTAQTNTCANMIDEFTFGLAMKQSN